MEREGWRPFLKRWSEEWISAHDPESDRPLDPDVVREGWLGFAPASPDAISALEGRLGLTLPPSLRTFLEVTDGWRDAGHFVYRLGGTAEIGFLRDMDAMWIDAYAQPYLDGDDETPAIGRMMRRSVQISLDGDACVLFLDPEDVNQDGEWAAYELASWSGMGPEHHPSFHDLMYDLYTSFHALRRPEGETRRTVEARVEEARLTALSGEVDGPLGVFGEAEQFGDPRATLLSVQMRRLLRSGGGRSLTHIAEAAWIFEDPVFESDLLPLLFADHDRSYGGSSELAILIGAHQPGPLRFTIADYQARLREPGFRLRFGNDEFDRAVHAVLDRLSSVPAFAVLESAQRPRAGVFVSPGPDRGTIEAAEQRASRALDAAWPAIRDALRLWRPVSEHHVAPVVLHADPLLHRMIDEERGREILSMPRGGGR